MYVKIDVALHEDPDILDAGPLAWVVDVALTCAAKQHGTSGVLPRRFARSSYLARRAGLDFPGAEEMVSAAIDALEGVGRIEISDDDVTICGWSSAQTDPTAALRQRRARAARVTQDDDASRGVTGVTRDKRDVTVSRHRIGEDRSGEDRSGVETDHDDSATVDPVDWAGLKDGWNAVASGAPGLRGLRSWTPARKSSLRVRAAEMAMSPAEAWAWVCGEVAGSDFLSGRTGRDGRHSAFSVDVDWVLKPANFVKIREGKYRSRRAQAQRQLAIGAPQWADPQAWAQLTDEQRHECASYAATYGEEIAGQMVAERVGGNHG